VPGHWEGDLIKGKLNQSRVGTLVERSTLFVAVVKLEDGRAETTANGFASILNHFDSQMWRSLTYDQDREMAQHRSLSQQANIKVYFAHPHSHGNAASTKHQRTAPSISAKRTRSQPLLTKTARRHRHDAQRQNPKIPRIEGTAELFLPKGSFNFQQRCTWCLNPPASIFVGQGAAPQTPTLKGC
jgi:transposase, IS30 family